MFRRPEDVLAIAYSRLATSMQAEFLQMASTDRIRLGGPTASGIFAGRRHIIPKCSPIPPAQSRPEQGPHHSMTVETPKSGLRRMTGEIE
jgi:hypothetical protein